VAGEVVAVGVLLPVPDSFLLSAAVVFPPAVVVGDVLTSPATVR